MCGLAGAILGTTTSCIDEAVSTEYATEESLSSSAKAAEAMVWAMPATLTQVNSMENSSTRHYDFGYPAVMHITDLFSGDMPTTDGNYNNFWFWCENAYLAYDYAPARFMWTFFRAPVLAANNVIGLINENTATDTELGFLAAAHTFRAFTYLSMAQLYEFLPNDVTDSITSGGNELIGLTVPIVTPETTEAEARNNPRATHEEMFTFLENDLKEAEKHIDKLTLSSKTLPSLGVVYGLFARLYMWNADYAKAEEYARKAIDLGKNTPLTRAEWLNTETGFNTLSTSSWMWGMQNVKEDDAVQSGLVNWVSWMCNEEEFGYTSAGEYVMIDGKLYSQISDNDFRKLSFKAPEGSGLSGQEPYIDADIFNALPDYASLKFRPGGGVTGDVNTSAAVAIPLMRIEEMYLIEAEAAAHQNPAKGKQLLTDFMTTYRYAKYKTSASTEEEVVNEIFKQKRIEFFGEGIIMYDYKRLNKSVDRAYESTEAYTNNWADNTRFRTNGRPAWMNFVIHQLEVQNNAAIGDYMNPDPTDAYPSY